MPPHPLPIPLTGRLLVVLTSQAVLKLARWASSPAAMDLENLSDLGTSLGYPELTAVLDRYGPPPSSRAIDSLSLSQLLLLDEGSSSGPFPPTHSLTAYWIVDTAGAEPTTTRLMADLLGVREAVAAVYREQAVGPPPAAPLVDWTDDDYASQQSHLDPAPTGIDTKWVWDHLRLHGAGIDFVDIEMGWNLNHEDLVGQAPVRLTPPSWEHSGWVDHGTAVLGLVAGVDNDKGIVGIAPGVNSIRVVSHWNGTVSTKVADAIAQAALVMGKGDVLLVEAQTGGNWPIEILAGQLELNAIKAATNKDIIVIEPAGNGGKDMDAWITDWSGPYASGAIMVGASNGDPPSSGAGAPHTPLNTSNASVRVDCFAPGQELVSTGGGDLADLGANATYTAGFGETSGASAVVAGAAILVQHMHAAATGGQRLGAVEMRALLSDSKNGTKQGAAGHGNIGTMPDLRRIAGALIDVYLRDHPGDDGSEPSTGPLSSSPDIIVVPAIEPDPQGTYGEGSGTENSSTLSQAVRAGVTHQVYARVRNRGICPAQGVTVTVHWSPVATLVTPPSWTLIGTSTPFNVPAGDVLTVSPAIPWPAAQLPAPGHYCFVAQAHHSYDPPPDPPPATDWNGFLSYLRRSNNVTWRNFNVLSASELSLGRGAWFWMRGAPDQARVFDFEILQRLPPGVRLHLDIPPALVGALRGPFSKWHTSWNDEPRVALALPAMHKLLLPRVRLGADARHPCRFVLLLDDPGPRVQLERAFGSIAIRQLYQGQEVGRITWSFRPGGQVDR